MNRSNHLDFGMYWVCTLSLSHSLFLGSSSSALNVLWCVCVQTTGSIIHSTSKLCLDRADIKSNGDVILAKCSGSDSQRWEFEHYL